MMRNKSLPIWILFLICISSTLTLTSPARADFAVQVGSFKEEGHAKEMAADLLDAGYTVYIEGGPKGFHRVKVGPYKTRSEAEKIGKQLKEKMKLSFFVSTVILPPSQQVIKPNKEALKNECDSNSFSKAEKIAKILSRVEDSSVTKVDLRNILSDPSAELKAIQEAEDVILEAKTHMGRPYVWAGSSPSAGGFDCSGFVYYLFTKRGYKLGRRASEQFLQGLPVDRSELRRGDLVFFRTYFNGASHVGIYLGGNEFIHSSSSGGGVVINQICGYYDERFYGARRILGVPPSRLNPSTPPPQSPSLEVAPPPIEATIKSDTVVVPIAP